MHKRFENKTFFFNAFRLFSFAFPARLLSLLMLAGGCLSPFALFAQPNTWVAVYGGNKYDRGSGIAPTHDKGYVVCGNTSSYGIGTTDVYVLKIDSAGQYEWQNTFGGANIDNAYSLQRTSDSGFVISGYTNSLGVGGYDAYLVKINSDGLFQWQKAYGDNDWDFAYWAEQTNDGGYILCGESYRSSKNSQAYLVRTNASGDTLWTKTFGSSGEDAFREVHQTADGGFITAGYTTGSAGDKDFFLVKTDGLGNMSWEKTFGSAANDSCSSLDICADGGFVMGGCRDTLGKHKSYFIKTDANGNQLLSKTHMSDVGNRSISRIRETVEKHYVYTQICDQGGFGGQEIYLIQYDPTGDWYPFVSTMGGNKDEEAYDFVQNADSGYTLVGYTETFGPGPNNIFLARTNKTGNYNIAVTSFVAVDEIHGEESDLMIYPNPNDGKFKVSSLKFKVTALRIHTILGEVILNSEGLQPEFDISAQPNGIYLIECDTEEGRIRKKILVSK